MYIIILFLIAPAVLLLEKYLSEKGSRESEERRQQREMEYKIKELETKLDKLEKK